MIRSVMRAVAALQSRILLPLKVWFRLDSCEVESPWYGTMLRRYRDISAFPLGGGGHGAIIVD
jgi:hypothetical protein